MGEWGWYSRSNSPNFMAQLTRWPKALGLRRTCVRGCRLTHEVDEPESKVEDTVQWRLAQVRSSPIGGSKPSPYNARLKNYTGFSFFLHSMTRTTTKCSQTPCSFLHLFMGLRRSHIQNGFHLVGVNPKVFTKDSVSKEFPVRMPKLHLVGFSLSPTNWRSPRFSLDF